MDPLYIRGTIENGETAREAFQLYTDANYMIVVLQQFTRIHVIKYSNVIGYCTAS